MLVPGGSDRTNEQQQQQQQQSYQPFNPSLSLSSSVPQSQGLHVPDTRDGRRGDDASSQGHSSLSSSVEDKNPFRQLKNKNSNTKVGSNDSPGPGINQDDRPLSIFNPTIQDLSQSSLPTPPVPPPPPNVASVAPPNQQYFPDPNLAQNISQLSIGSGSSSAAIPVPMSNYPSQAPRHSPSHSQTSGGAWSGSPSTNTNPFQKSPSPGKSSFYEGHDDDDELLPGLPAKSASPSMQTPPLPPKTSLSPAPPTDRVYTPDSAASEQAAATTAAGNGKQRATDEDTTKAPSSTDVKPSTERTTSPPPIPQETYLIKHIRYLEPLSNKIKRGSILLQNENGPCPLIALVNVLSLSRECLVLAEALRLREQLSLELLLQVVCEELVLAGNWAGDLTELFTFLLDLRKGMNVNPQFVGDEIKAEDFLGGQNVAAHKPLPNPRPGAFVQTRDIQLYNAFAVPLVHGWLPSPTSPFFPVLVTHARDFEKAQDLIIQQQFIIEKHSQPDAGEMSVDDSEIVSRAYEVQEFLDASGTQLTSYGFDVLARTLSPGEYCIFFRNDHFSTLHKHAVTGELYTLVTDAGYASYEEIVWESLVDGRGRGGSHFSGDFRPIGHEGSEIRGQQQALARRQQKQPVNTASAEDDWRVVQNRRHGHRIRASNAAVASSSIAERVAGPELPPRRSSLNQTMVVPEEGADTTDFDLALAIHLQQEEDERANRASRSADTANYRPMTDVGAVPSNNNANNRRTSGYRPPQPPRTPASAQAAAAAQQARGPTGDPSIDDPPPRYERVDSNTVGGVTTPHQRSVSSAYPGSQYHNPSAAGTHQSGQSAYAQMSGYPDTHRRRASQGAQDKDKCVLM